MSLGSFKPAHLPPRPDLDPALDPALEPDLTHIGMDRDQVLDQGQGQDQA